MMTLKETPNSLGFLKPTHETKVIVAMSGGVDSSTVAGLMKMQGYNVTGINSLSRPYECIRHHHDIL